MAERRWTIWNSSKRFTVQKADASPIPLGTYVETMPVSDHLATLESLAAELEGRSERKDRSSNSPDNKHVAEGLSGEATAYEAASQLVRSYLGDEGRG